MLPDGRVYVSAVHSIGDIDETADAMEGAIANL
jgi:hypothetical protein